MDILQTIISALGIIAFVIFIKVINPYIKEKINEIKDSKEYNIVQNLVLSAEQLYPASQMGKVKFQYVENCLSELGIEFTPKIKILIEAFVSGLNGNIIR